MDGPDQSMELLQSMLSASTASITNHQTFLQRMPFGGDTVTNVRVLCCVLSSVKVV